MASPRPPGVEQTPRTGETLPPAPPAHATPAPGAGLSGSSGPQEPSEDLFLPQWNNPNKQVRAVAAILLDNIFLQSNIYMKLHDRESKYTAV